MRSKKSDIDGSGCNVLYCNITAVVRLDYSVYLCCHNLLTILSDFIHLFFLCAVLFAFACVGLCTVEKGENGNPQINNMPAGAEAAYLIITGEAQDFHDQMTQRSALLRQAKDQDVTLSPLTSKPDLLFYLDITSDPSCWENQAVAAYYGNRSVVLSE